ncbi:unnamed protein product [Rotaria magnacalcarata]|uniref:Uncharacterized protein n=2 Tax=Rotaria magnacalcarata TaxID=392030 RepID=A0A815ST38_9BILA|nr:unnamed protein product [Rotaria magnacalcarata]CAF1534356.1 unnamed protein product [Rotaria magnacalcarata]CAF2126142.1 unnamed protein product [Rotaria magnacalcarata]
MSTRAYSAAAHAPERQFYPSNEMIGFEKASRLLMVGGGCLLIVLIFGIILCRLDISAGRKRRTQSFQQVEIMRLSS